MNIHQDRGFERRLSYNAQQLSRIVIIHVEESHGGEAPSSYI